MFNWKLESIKRMFGLKKSNKGRTARKLNIENLEERIECATKVWDGSLVGIDPVLAVGGDPTFSSFMAGYSQATDSTNSLAQNWASTFGQVSLPNNGDTLVFPTITQSTPGTNVFGPLGGVTVNVINDMSPDSNGNLAGYLRDTVTGENLVNPLVNVDSIVFNGTGYFVYGRDNPQFGPANVAGLIPPGTTLTIAPTSVYNPELFFPGASTTGYTWFNPAVPTGSQATVNSGTVVVNATGGIVTIPVLGQGSGYTSVPNVTITGGTGTGATARANILNGRVTSITVLTAGTGYSSAPGTTGTFFNGTVTIAAPNQGTLTIDPSSPVNPITNISTTPAVPLNIQTSILANYNVALANRNIVNPNGITTPNANYNFMPINLGNPNAPEGSAFLINVNQEGTWLIMNSDLENSSNPSGTTPGNYTLINDVNNNKIIKDGLGILVFESSNQYTGTTVVQQGLLIVSDNSGLGDALTNSNVEVYGGTLLIGVDRYNSKQSQNFNTTTIANRNLVLYGGDGYIPTIAAVAGSKGNTVTIPVGTPMGEFNGRDGLFATPHQWDGTVTLNSNSSLITQSATPGDAYGFTSGTGVVGSINITNGGTGYSATPIVTIQAPGQAVAGTPVITAGAITSIPLLSGGSGYTVAPTITITGGGGTGAVATATLTNGVVTGIAITSGGIGYTSSPTINISAPNQAIGRTQAIAGTPLITAGAITSIPILSGGSGYTFAPIVTITDTTGTGATATANLIGSSIANPTGDPSIGQDYASYTEINGVISGAAGFRKWGTGTVELTQANTFSGDVVVFDGFLNVQNVTGLGITSSANPKNIIVREMPASLVGGNQQLAGALTLGDEVNGGQNLVFGSQYNLVLQDGNPSTTSNNGPDQSPIPAIPVAGTTGTQGLGAFQVVSPNNNPNKVEWQGDVNIQTNASIGGTPNSELKISGQITSTLPATAGAPTIAGGRITAIPVTSGSSGYLSAPTVTITGGGGTGATATATLTNGVVTAITVTNGGTGYTRTPTITLSAPGIQLEKRGSMDLIITNDNTSTFQGSWLVSNGNLILQNNGALGNATSINVTQQLSPTLPALSGAGSIQVDGYGLNIQNNVTIQGTGYNGFGALQSIGQNTWSGTISVAGTASVGVGIGSELIVSGQITQTAGITTNNQLVKNGAGTVILSTAQNSLTLPVLVQEGTLIVQAPGNLGAGASGSSQVTVSTSVPVNSATLALDGGTAGKLSISNRTLNLDGAGVSGAGALRSISGNNTWAGNINLSGTSQVAYVGVDTDTLTLSGNITGGSSTLQKTGAGDLVISGSGNTHKSTVVGAGTVYQLGQDNVPVFVNTSGTLTGNGKIGVLNMTAGQNGTVTPGTQTSSVAVLTTSGISAQSSVGVFSFDLNTSGTVAGTAYDQIAVNGTVNLSGSPVLNVKLNFNPIVSGNSYTIISNDGSDPVVGIFSGQAEGSLVTVLDAEGDSVSYRISYVGGTGNDVTLTCVGVLTTNVLTSSDVDNLTQYGEAVTFTSTISALTGTVTRGTVTYFDQGVSIGQAPVVNGVATFTTTTLSVNGSPHVITSRFVGQGILGQSDSNIIAQSVNKSSSSVAVTTNSQPYGTNLPLTVTATVTPQYAGGPATGQVLIRIDGVIQPLQTISTTVTDPTTGATTATLLTSISTTGFHTIDALYLGDSNINGSAFSPIFNQQILTTAITTLGLVSSRNPADRLATITFTASVTNPIIPAESTIGLVQFLDNGVALGAPVAVSNNVATYSTSTLTGGRHTITANYLGSPNGSNTRYFSSSTGTIYQAVTATSNLVITGTNEGGGPQVNVYNLLTQETTNFFAFAPSFKGGVRVASGDVTGDGIADVVVAAGPGGGPQVNVYDGTNLELVHSFYAYNAAFDDGIFVTVGDVNGDGYADIITGAGQGGGPHVQVFSGQNYSNIASFFAYNPVFTGGISVASGDVNGDGYSDVVVGAGPGGGPHVLAVSGLQLSQGTQVVLASFFAFDPGINQGVFVGAGDYNGDIVGDIVVAAGPGGGPHVKVFNGSGTSLIDTFFAYDINFAGGLSVAMADIDNDGLAEIVTAPYTNGGPEVKVFRYQKGQLYNFYAYDPLFTGGVFVG